MAYHIVFRGQLKPGVSKAQTIERLAQVTGLDATQIERGFFTGKAVKLKALDSREKAEALAAKLHARDIVVDVATSQVESPTTPGDSAVDQAPPKQSTTNQSNSKLPPTIKTQPVKRNSKVPLILASAAVPVAVAVGVGLFFLWRLFDTSVPAFVNKAENTLLHNEQAVLLGHVNVAQLVKMENIVRDVEPAAPNPRSDDFWDQLILNGVDPRQQIDQVIFSLNFDDVLGPYFNGLLLTSADPGAVKSFLNKNYEVDVSTESGVEVIRFRKQDIESCQYTQAQGLVIGDGYIVLSHPEKVAALYQQLQSADATQVVNQQWVDYRSQRLLSVGLLQPDQLNNGSLGIAGLFLSGLQSEWQSMQAVFAGVQGAMMPPSVSFDFTVVSDDQQWLTSSQAKLQQVMDEMDPGNSEILAQLKRKIAIEADNQQLGTRFTIDGELVEAGEKLFNEGLGSLISVSTSSSGGGMDTAGMEQIDEDPEQYRAAISRADIPAFENRYNQHFDWIEGPFAGKLNTIGINRDGLTTVEVVVETQGMPNPPDSSTFGDPGGITAIDVKDTQGNSLLQVETCGTELNHHPALFQFGSKATKKVRLKSGANVNDIASIDGEVSMRVATQTETERLALPLQTTTFHSQGSELKIGAIEGGSINFSIGGTPGGFLALRALNKEGKYLASGGSFSMNNSVSQQFYGEIHSLELVKALRYETIGQTFTFNSAVPTQSDGGFGDDFESAQGYDTTDWDNVLLLAETLNPEDDNNAWLGEPAASTQAGPAKISLYQSEVYRQFDGITLNTDMVLAMPYVAALEDKSNAIQLQVNQLQFANGESAFPLHTTPIPVQFSSLTSGGYKDLNKTELELRQDLYLQGRTSLNVPLKNDNLAGATLSQLQGELQFHLPTSVRTQEITDFSLGKVIDLDDLSIRVIGTGVGSLTLQVEGNNENLVDVLLLNSENKVLANGISFAEEQRRFGVKPNYRGEPEPPVRVVDELRFTGEPVKIVVMLADEKVVFRYPVVLDLSEIRTNQ